MENYRKTLKTMVFKRKFGFGSQLRVGKVLAPHNVHLKTVPSLIKCARYNLMFKIFVVPQKIKQNKKNTYENNKY